MSYFKVKMHQIRFRLGLRLDPAPSWILRGPTSKGRGGRKGKRGRGRKWEGEGRVKEGE